MSSVVCAAPMTATAIKPKCATPTSGWRRRSTRSSTLPTPGMSSSCEEPNAVARTPQTPLGPLPEDFFGLSDDPTPKEKFQAQLAEAHDIWRRAQDDQEGRKLRLLAYQVAIGAVLEYAKDDAPPAHLYLLARLAEQLDDIKRGRWPEEFGKIRRRRGNPGLETSRADTLAEACAIVHVLSKGRGSGRIKEIEDEVAGAIGKKSTAFRSWRKAFNAGKKGPRAREHYSTFLRILQEQPEPRRAARRLLEILKQSRKFA